MWVVLTILAVFVAAAGLATQSVEVQRGIDLLGIHSRLSVRYLILFATLSIYFVYVIRRKRDSLRHLILLFALLAIALLDGGGNALNLYTKTFVGIYYDGYMHFIIPFMASFAVGLFISQNDGQKGMAFGSILLGALLIFQMAVLFEIYEYYSDVYIGTDMVQGLHDTINDLLLDYLGCAAAVGALVIYSRLLERKAASK
ncbi:MAG: hypothetical protein QY318_03700 [Candidatus Dojkabacteria bacterium]|nr:MAG: hypothetical protein QY318_03700 [Candidatus Dojkabacteria bacterium]